MKKSLYNYSPTLKVNLKAIVDMGIIDDKGIQLLYTGPYNLKGKDYSQADWFKEMFLEQIM